MSDDNLRPWRSWYDPNRMVNVREELIDGKFREVSTTLPTWLYMAERHAFYDKLTPTASAPGQ